MNYENLTADTKVTLLLCGETGMKKARGEKPLKPHEFARLTRWLEKRGMRPSHLLDSFGINALSDFYNKSITVGRIHSLLERESIFEKSLKNWEAKGIWILCSFDADYPFLLKSRLKSQAPPLLYGAGNMELLNAGGIAIVGADEAEEADFELARKAASVCAGLDIPVLSWGGKGASGEALSAVLAEKGRGICVIPSSLSRATGSRIYKEYLENEGFLLVSPFHPESGFDEMNLLSRNKYVFAMAQYTLVINTEKEKGDCLNICKENLNNNRFPMFVHRGDNTPEGNETLLESGAIPFDPGIFDPPGEFAAKMEDKIRDYERKSEERKPEKQKLPDYYEELPEDFFDFEDGEEEEKKAEQLELPGFWE